MSPLRVVRGHVLAALPLYRPASDLLHEGRSRKQKGRRGLGHKATPQSVLPLFAPSACFTRLTQEGSIPLVHIIPVNDVIKCGDVVSRSVLVLEVIRMFPNVDPKHGAAAGG